MSPKVTRVRTWNLKQMSNTYWLTIDMPSSYLEKVADVIGGRLYGELGRKAPV